MHTNIPQHLFRPIHLVRTYLMTDFFKPFFPCTHMYPFRVTPLCVRDFINLIPFPLILTLLICHSFFVLFYLRTSRIDVFVLDTHHLLASHLVFSSLHRKTFLLMVVQTVSYFIFNDHRRSLAMQMQRRGTLGELLW